MYQISKGWVIGSTTIYRYRNIQPIIKIKKKIKPIGGKIVGQF